VIWIIRIDNASTRSIAHALLEAQEGRGTHPRQTKWVLAISCLGHDGGCERSTEARPRAQAPLGCAGLALVAVAAGLARRAISRTPRHTISRTPARHIADASTPYRGRFRQHASRRGRFCGTYPVSRRCAARPFGTQVTTRPYWGNVGLICRDTAICMEALAGDDADSATLIRLHPHFS
jgi:hypothetical protein